MPASRDAAARFLTQASFGPTTADIDRVMAIGYAAWIDEQFTRPVSSHRATWEAADAAAKAADPGNANAGAGQNGAINAFWKAAVSGDDQLRQRVAYALSQIIVISMQDGTVGDNPRAVAAYLDMLADKGLGNYRDLLEGVSLHPMMGVYLTHLRNQKDDPATGRVPDENYAREVMQLFSIGLVELNADGTRSSTPAQPHRHLHAAPTSAAWPRCSPAGAGIARPGRPRALLRVRPTRATPTASASRCSAIRVPLDEREELPRQDDRRAGHAPTRRRPEDRPRHAGRPPQRRPLHRQAADPAPGDQQPEPGLRGGAWRAASPTTAAACAAT